MLSAQCDELRAMAESVGLEVPRAATLMMEAADTIWELRDSVHRERAEADKLREQGARMFDKTLELGTENAKLRELIRDMWSEGMCECGSLGKCATCMYEYPTRMRELGVEP